MPSCPSRHEAGVRRSDRDVQAPDRYDLAEISWSRSQRPEPYIFAGMGRLW